MSTYKLNYQLHEKTHRRILSEQNAFDPVGWLTRFLIKHSTYFVTYFHNFALFCANLHKICSWIANAYASLYRRLSAGWDTSQFFQTKLSLVQTRNLTCDIWLSISKPASLLCSNDLYSWFGIWVAMLVALVGRPSITKPTKRSRRIFTLWMRR